MDSVWVRNSRDLTLLRYRHDELDEVCVDARALKRRGLLRHAFKYALWALRPDGVVKVFDEPSRSQLFTTKRIDFWQTRHEFFKAVGEKVSIERVDDKSGQIFARKVSAQPSPSGISFCIVYGGGDKDTALLNEALRSIHESALDHLECVEVVVCGPIEPNFAAQVAARVPGLAVRHLPYDGQVIAGRIPLSDKKNRVFNAARFDLVVLSHTRITFEKTVVKTLLVLDFEVLAPRVDVLYGGKKARFLDYILIGHYHLAHKNSANALGGYFMPDNHLEAMKRRVPYVDGGVMIFNKQVIPLGPFDPRLAWGEAEDVDACANLHQKGALIDFDERVRCQSRVVKFNPVPSRWGRLIWPIKQLLVRFGWY